MRAEQRLKHNIDALLRARGQTRHDLALWCRRSDSWLSKIFAEPRTASDRAERSIPLKYLDRMADFFGLATYQLFQPGISPLTERRSGRDRRQGQDRRISRHDASPTTIRVPLTVEDETIVMGLHALSYEDYQHVKAWVASHAKAAQKGG